MPRPFAVAGFSMLFVMLVLCCTGIGPCLYISLFLVVAFALSMAFPAIRKQRVLPVALAAGVVSCALFSVSYYTQYKPALDLAGSDCNIKAVLKDGGGYDYGRWYYNAETVTVNGADYKCSIRISFRDKLEADAYDEIEGNFTVYKKRYSSSSLFRINPSENLIGAYPSQYDTDTVSVTNIGDESKPFAYRIMLLRQSIRRNLLSVIPGENGAIACALLLGRTSEFPDSLRAKFNSAGVAHIICVSGLHLSLWALFILELFKKTGMSKRMVSAISVLAVLGYMTLTGFSYSVIRAGVMIITVLLANILSRRADSLNSLGFAVAVILSFNPFSACDVSFQLSFLATLGLLTLMPYLNRRLEERLSGMGEKTAKIIRYFAVIILTAMCACAFTLPVSIINFGEVNLMSFAGNMLVIPAVSVCMILSGVTAALTFAGPLAVLSYLSGLLCTLSAKYIGFVVSRLSQLSAFTFHPETKLAYLWLGGVFIILGTAVYFAFLNKNVIRLTAILLTASFVSMLVISSVFYYDLTQITVIDSGNASAVLVTKGSSSALIGCGDDSFTSSTDIMNELENRHIESLNLLLVPQTGKYESGSVNDVLACFSADVFACSSLPEWSLLGAGEAEAVEYGEHFTMQVFDGCRVTAVNDESGCFVIVGVPGHNVFIPYNKGADASSYSPDFMVCRGYLSPYYEKSSCAAAILYGREDIGAYVNSAVNSGTLCVSTAGNGNVVLSFSADGRYKLSRKTDGLR